MESIRNKIIKKIKSNKGFITLDNFIKISMYDSKNGYYIKENPIGKSADFITAPEISQLFGELIGLYIYDHWRNYINKKFTLIELGPGKGTLISDLINISSNFQNYLSKINLILLEKNLKLIEYQKNILRQQSQNLSSLKWLRHLNKIPKQETVIIANEFFDCFPTKQFFKIKNNHYENIVKYDSYKNNFFIDNKKIYKSSRIIKEINEIYSSNNFEDGKIIEISPTCKNYIKKISDILLKNNGLLILIDYGNINPTGLSTIQSIKNHKKSNLLNDPGKQDLSFMLSFSLLKKMFQNNNLKVYGPFTQKDFLISLGINKRKDNILKNRSASDKRIFELGMNRLIDKNQMGELFKVLIVSSRKIDIYV